MKIIRKVSRIEVKRAFVTAQKMRLSHRKRQRYLPILTRKEFLTKLKRSKRTVNALNERQLDRIIAKEYLKRANAYNNSKWYLVSMSSKELGVWRRAGGLPPEWTCCNLNKTASYVKKGLKINSTRIRARSKRAIPRIMEFSDIIVKEKRLFPIVFTSNTGTRGRSLCRTKTRGDIDDGCMRTIALAICGIKKFKVYFGKSKKKII